MEFSPYVPWWFLPGITSDCIHFYSAPDEHMVPSSYLVVLSQFFLFCPWWAYGPDILSCDFVSVCFILSLMSIWSRPRVLWFYLSFFLFCPWWAYGPDIVSCDFVSVCFILSLMSIWSHPRILWFYLSFFILSLMSLVMVPSSYQLILSQFFYSVPDELSYQLILSQFFYSVPDELSYGPILVSINFISVFLFCPWWTYCMVPSSYHVTLSTYSVPDTSYPQGFRSNCNLTSRVYSPPWFASYTLWPDA